MFLFSKEGKRKKESMVFHHRSIKVSKKRVRMIVKGDTKLDCDTRIENFECVYTRVYTRIHMYASAYRCTYLKRTCVRTDSWPLNISKGLVAI